MTAPVIEQVKIRTEDMPSDMRILLDDYPRESWTKHPGFQEKTRGWLKAHTGFRRLSRIVKTDTQNFIDRKLSGEQFGVRLSHYGGILVGNLHGHHSWEDHSYFPELLDADPRFAAGLELLESDHVTLNAALDAFTSAANQVLGLLRPNEVKARDYVGVVLDHADTIEKLLDRHLSDEEELAVPIILHYRLRG